MVAAPAVIVLHSCVIHASQSISGDGRPIYSRSSTPRSPEYNRPPCAFGPPNRGLLSTDSLSVNCFSPDNTTRQHFLPQPLTGRPTVSHTPGDRSRLDRDRATLL